MNERVSEQMNGKKPETNERKGTERIQKEESGRKGHHGRQSGHHCADRDPTRPERLVIEKKGHGAKQGWIPTLTASRASASSSVKWGQ